MSIGGADLGTRPRLGLFKAPADKRIAKLEEQCRAVFVTEGVWL